MEKEVAVKVALSDEELNTILQAWAASRNNSQKGVQWHFTTADARIKLKHLYPIIEM